MSYPVSACVFIRDCFVGAFCLFESMASLMPLVEEFVVMDLGSTDGTLEALNDIARHNGKVKLLVRSKGFPKTDAGVFADLGNELVGLCKYDAIWYFQADEIPHQDLLELIEEKFKQELFDWSFWRVQLGWNFQEPRWYPHLVHRIGQKGNYELVGDGMTTSRTWDAPICSDFGGEYFQQWGGMGVKGIQDHIHQMLLDVSLLGGFRDNIVERKRLHAPFWNEQDQPLVENKPLDQWHKEALQDERWTWTESPFDIPAIMKYHIGKIRYELRDDLKTALEKNETLEYIKSLV